MGKEDYVLLIPLDEKIKSKKPIWRLPLNQDKDIIPLHITYYECILRITVSNKYFIMCTYFNQILFNASLHFCASFPSIHMCRDLFYLLEFIIAAQIQYLQTLDNS